LSLSAGVRKFIAIRNPPVLERVSTSETADDPSEVYQCIRVNKKGAAWVR